MTKLNGDGQDVELQAASAHHRKMRTSFDLWGPPQSPVLPSMFEQIREEVESLSDSQIAEEHAKILDEEEREANDPLLRGNHGGGRACEVLQRRALVKSRYEEIQSAKKRK